jgi:hypothetical protein
VVKTGLPTAIKIVRPRQPKAAAIRMMTTPTAKTIDIFTES